ncbi:hypothetical protein PENSPDRAFT_305191 [Peniophora sp. CONT]|nr:hypothetical protein PENSPDRAFT_305191 [Peniophora sp. CONT]
MYRTRIWSILDNHRTHLDQPGLHYVLCCLHLPSLICETLGVNAEAQLYLSEALHKQRSTAANKFKITEQTKNTSNVSLLTSTPTRRRSLGPPPTVNEQSPEQTIKNLSLNAVVSKGKKYTKNDAFYLASSAEEEVDGRARRQSEQCFKVSSRCAVLSKVVRRGTGRYKAVHDTGLVIFTPYDYEMPALSFVACLVCRKRPMRATAPPVPGREVGGQWHSESVPVLSIPRTHRAA